MVYKYILARALKVTLVSSIGLQPSHHYQGNKKPIHPSIQANWEVDLLDRGVAFIELNTRFPNKIVNFSWSFSWNVFFSGDECMATKDCLFLHGEVENLLQGTDQVPQVRVKVLEMGKVDVFIMVWFHFWENRRSCGPSSVTKSITKW